MDYNNIITHKSRSLRELVFSLDDEIKDLALRGLYLIHTEGECEELDVIHEYLYSQKLLDVYSLYDK